MANYKNILIIQTAFIGDAILASCLVEKLNSFFPKSNISILVRKGNETLYSFHPFLKEILIWTKNEKKIRNLFQLLFQIRKNKYDCVINCHRFLSSGILTSFSGANHTSGFKQNPLSFLFNHTVNHSFQKNLHETKRYNQLIEDFTDQLVFKPKLYPSTTDYDFTSSFKKQNYFCIAPASVWQTKQLPIHKWVQLCNILNTSHTVYLIGASSDSDLCNEIKTKSNHQNIQVLAGKLTFLQASALIQNAKMNYVNDSAPLHLASAVNAPVTAFFMSTVKNFGFGPLSDNSKIIEVENLNCRPCGIHGHLKCPLQHFNCGNLIEINSI